MSLTARAKAVRGVGYSPLLRAVHGLLAVAVQPPTQPPTSYLSPWAYANSHARDHYPTRPAQPRRSRRRREVEFFVVNH